MTTFENIKERVTVPQAASYYGIMSRNGMCCCFEHNDKHPSMKLYEKNYHCFGCGAHGDVIALVANICGISMIEAAKRINADFGLGLDMDKPVSRSDIIMIQRRKQEEQDYAEWENHAFNVLSEYHKLLLEWRSKAPASSDDIPDKHYVESINTLDYCEYIFDCFLNGNKEERLQMKREVDCFEQRIYTKHHLKFGKNQADNLEYIGFRRRFFPVFYWCLVLRIQARVHYLCGWGKRKG